MHLTTRRASKQSSYQGHLRRVHCPCWRWSGPIPVRISPLSSYCPRKVSITRHLMHEAVIRWKSKVSHPKECPGYQKTRACSLLLVEIILKKKICLGAKFSQNRQQSTSLPHTLWWLSRLNPSCQTLAACQGPNLSTTSHQRLFFSRPLAPPRQCCFSGGRLIFPSWAQ